MAYGVGDHGREHGSVGIVCVELPHQDGDHGELYDEDDGMEERLEGDGMSVIEAEAAFHRERTLRYHDSSYR
jgi:hypothetical protein